ncbi:MAG: ABC transporter ATP-binding protein [Nitrospinota bacterium]
MSGNREILAVENLSASYGRIEALRAASLRTGEGEIVTLIGANGAGKSSLLRAISGILKPRSGSVRFLGEPLTFLSPHRIVQRGIVQVQEGRGILGYMTVLENLELGSYVRKDREGIQKDLKEVLLRFPILEERLQQLGASLSGGEQQMLAIARALMARPKLLMMDEPSLGLAPKLVNEVFSIIRGLKKEGKTILLVEQNARKALQCADRGYVMESGEIVMEGSAKELLESPRVKAAYLGG